MPEHQTTPRNPFIKVLASISKKAVLIPEPERITMEKDGLISRIKEKCSLIPESDHARFRPLIYKLTGHVKLRPERRDRRVKRS